MDLKRVVVLCIGSLLLACQGCSGGGSGSGGAPPNPNQLVIDPAPPGITPSAQYTVQLSQPGPGQAQSAFVYQIQNPGFLANGQPSGVSSSSTLEQATAWASFSFAGAPVTVQVTNSQPFASARVLPSHAGIAATVSGNTVSFVLTQPGQFAVDFCPSGSPCTEANDTDLSNPMLVFANPVETAAPNAGAANVQAVTPGLSVPAGASQPQLSGSQNTLYFAPGVYDLGLTPLSIASNETVYLAGGAYVKGFLALAQGASNVSILGRGILSGEDLPKAQCIGTAAGCPDMLSGVNVQNLNLEGLSFILSPYYNINITGQSSGDTVNNVKVLAWLGNSDGIQASNGALDTGSLIENSFVKNGDDSIKLTSSNLTVKSCVVWKLNNAAAFEMGAGIAVNLSNITVEDSDVIRGEYSYPDTSDAVFAANQGGKGDLSGYTFNDIRIENEAWQLFKIDILPSNFESGNEQFGSIGNLTFTNIQATDAQQFPPVFRGFDLAHPISNVQFDNVVAGGVTLPQPTLSFDANRNMSYAGNTVGDVLYQDSQQAGQFGVPVFQVPFPSTGPQYLLEYLTQPNLASGFVAQGSGDFFGDGYASAVFTETASGQVGIWKEPYLDNAMPWASQYAVVYTLGIADGSVAGVGDFNGDGYSDILLWNSSTQTGKILLMDGDQIIGEPTFQPATASTWSVAAVADFNGDGYSDVLLRDTSGNLEIVDLNPAAPQAITSFAESSLYYNSTAQYTAAYGSTSGHFGPSWNVAGAGIFQTLGTEYAALIWVNPTTRQVGMTNFTPWQKSLLSGQVFAQLPSGTQIQLIADVNADGAKDLVLWNADTAQSIVWLTNFDNGARYAVGPTLQPGLPAGWQPVPN